MTETAKPTCKFCNKTFVRESTLFVHQCEQKRRFIQKSEQGPRLGLISFNQFFKAATGSKPKSCEDFRKSPYYTGFVKFGWYVHKIRATNITGFIQYLIDNNIKLDWWAKDRYYEKFIIAYMKRENPMDAIARTIEELDRWGEENKLDFNLFFKTATQNRVASFIANGRISPWVLFNCDHGTDILGQFTQEQMGIAFKWIDPDFWLKKFEDNPDDVLWVKEILDEAGFNK